MGGDLKISVFWTGWVYSMQQIGSIEAIVQRNRIGKRPGIGLRIEIDK
jgi:hypothetical protein